MKKDILIRFVAAIFILFVAGCAFYDKKEALIEGYEKKDITSALKNINISLNTFKGIGKITFIDNDKTIPMRMAFAGSFPKKIRIILMDAVKMPAFSISYDAKTFYSISYNDNKFYKKEDNDFNFKNIIGVCATIEEIVSYMAGRFVADGCKSLYIEKDEFDDSKAVIFFKCFGSKTKVYFDQNKLEVEKIERLGFLNKKNFTAEFSNYKKIGKYNIPFKLSFFNEKKDRGAVVEIKKYFPNEEIKDLLFVIKPN
jgi:hypothetical protein